MEHILYDYVPTNSSTHKAARKLLKFSRILVRFWVRYGFTGDST